MSKQNLDILFECLSKETYTVIDDKLRQLCRNECDIFKNTVNGYYGKARNLEDMLWFIDQCKYKDAKCYYKAATIEYEYLLQLVYDSSTVLQSEGHFSPSNGNEVLRNNFITGQTIHTHSPHRENNLGIRRQIAVHGEWKTHDGTAMPTETTNIPVLSSLQLGKTVADPLTAVSTSSSYSPQTNVNQGHSSYAQIRLDKGSSTNKELTNKDGQHLRTNRSEENAQLTKQPQFEQHVNTKPVLNKNDSSSYSKDMFNSDQRFDHNVGNDTKVEISTISRSRAASARLRKNNPNIVDLSDTNRPTKLAEKFSEVYDNEWTEAFVYLETKCNQQENIIIGFLFEVVTRAFRFCKDESARMVEVIDDAFVNVLEHGTPYGVANKRNEKMERKHNTTFLAQYLKEHAGKAAKRLQKEFCEGPAYLKKIYKDLYWTLDNSQGNPIVTYVNQCVELAWWMCVQDPPIYMDVMESTVMHAFNVATYKAYTKTGKIVDYYVWPALLLENGGAVLMKGIAQCK